MSPECSKCHLGGYGNSLTTCSKCKTARYCSKRCQTDHWTVHRPMCRPHDSRKVWGVKLLCKGDLGKIRKPRYENTFIQHVLLDDNHPVFKWADICPVANLCGIPLLIFSPVFHGGIRYKSAAAESAGQNQPAVYLRIEPDNGLAPVQWLNVNPGTCILARQDHHPLTREIVETVWKWHTKLINCFAYFPNDGWASPRDLMKPACFQLFSRDYYATQKEKGRIGFDPFYKPL